MSIAIFLLLHMTEEVEIIENTTIRSISQPDFGDFEILLLCGSSGLQTYFL